MKKKSISFILGAGASIPFGFPSNNDLYNKIISDLGLIQKFKGRPNFIDQHDDSIKRIQAIQDYYLIEEFKSLFDSLREFRYQAQSIDEFLEYHNELGAIGKLLITSTLLGYESSMRYENGTNWYKTLFNHRIFHENNLCDYQFNFFTFNYDRSLDEYMDKFYYRYKRLDNREMIQKIEEAIFTQHIYGKISDEFLFGLILPNHSAEIKEAISSSIKLYKERVYNGVFSEIAGRLVSSDKIYIFGFGFNETNVDRLFQNYEKPENQHIISSNFGIESDFRGNPLIPENAKKLSINFAPSNMEINDILLKFWPLDLFDNPSKRKITW